MFLEDVDFPGEGLASFNQNPDSFRVAGVPASNLFVVHGFEVCLKAVEQELDLVAVVEASEVGHAAFVPYGGLTVKGYLKVGEYPVFLRAWTIDAPQRIGVG